MALDLYLGASGPCGALASHDHDALRRRGLFRAGVWARLADYYRDATLADEELDQARQALAALRAAGAGDDADVAAALDLLDDACARAREAGVALRLIAD